MVKVVLSNSEVIYFIPVLACYNFPLVGGILRFLIIIVLLNFGARKMTYSLKSDTRITIENNKCINGQL